jgi:stress-induced morphogen
MPITQEQLEMKLKEHLEPVYLKVEDISDGCGSKYNVLIVSNKFEGQSLLNRQRLVNTIIANEMKQIHAFTQKCVTPQQWNKMLADNPELATTTTTNNNNNNNLTSNKKCEFHSS